MANTSRIDFVRSRLVAAGKEIAKDKGDRFTAQCPAHGDSNPSLDVFLDPYGHVGVKCWSGGCSTEAICEAIGIKPFELFREGTETDKFRGEERRVVAVHSWRDRDGAEQFQKVRYWPKTFMVRADVAEPKTGRRYSLKAGYYSYRNGNYKISKHTVKQGEPPEAGLIWLDAIHPDLYEAHRIHEAAESGAEIWLVEGEKDADYLNLNGMIATSTFDGGGAKKWKAKYSDTLKGAACVRMIPDRDKAGAKFAAQVVSALQKAGIPIHIHTPKQGKDPAEHFQAGYGANDFPETSLDEFLATYDVDAPEPPDSTPTFKLEAQEELPWLPSSDLDNTQLMVQLYGEEIRYCPPFKCWFQWDGSRWKEDQTEGAPILTRWSATAYRIRQQVADLPLLPDHAGKKTKAQRQAIESNAHKAQSHNGYAHMEKLLSRQRNLVIIPDDMDNHPELLPVANGVIDLRTGQMLEHDRERMFTRCLATAYNPAAKCPNWIQFLRQSTGDDEDYIRYLNMAIGYMLTGDTREQKFFFIHGPGGTGKTTFLDAIQHMLGEFASSLDVGHLMQKAYQGIPEHIARLRGARLVTAVEANRRDKFDEGLMKKLTGGEKIVARRLNENSFEFYASFKLVVTSNFRPGVSDDGTSFWRRMVALPFEHVVPPEEFDLDLPEKLKAEAAGILAWAVRGAKAWYKADRLDEPAALSDARRQYQEEADILHEFEAAHVRREKGEELLASDLYDAYVRWAERERERPIARSVFGRLVKARGILSERRTAGRRYYVGVRLVNTTDYNTEAEPRAAEPEEDPTAYLDEGGPDPFEQDQSPTNSA